MSTADLSSQAAIVPLSKMLFIVGPTASGKSDLALTIARGLCAHSSSAQPQILNCDSVQFFASVEIGAAKPSALELAEFPHHLIGHVSPFNSYSAGDFRRDALAAIEREAALGHRQWIGVGGSGFHIQALEKGMYDVQASSSEVREELERRADRDGVDVLHRELVARDPEAATKISVSDRYRILRALEILAMHPHEETLTSIRLRFERERPQGPFVARKIGVKWSREALRERVTMRTQAMLENGFVSEVETLRAQGLGATTPLNSVGYKEVQAYLDGNLKESELAPAIITGTMQLAKRQMTWFKRDPEIVWFEANEGWNAPLEQALEFLEGS